MKQQPLKDRISDAFWKNWLGLAAGLIFTALTITSYKQADYGYALFSGIMAGFEYGLFLMAVVYEMLVAEYQRLIELQSSLIKEFVDIGKQLQNDLDKALKEIEDGRSKTV